MNNGTDLPSSKDKLFGLSGKCIVIVGTITTMMSVPSVRHQLKLELIPDKFISLFKCQVCHRHKRVILLQDLQIKLQIKVIMKDPLGPQMPETHSVVD